MKNFEKYIDKIVEFVEKCNCSHLCNGGFECPFKNEFEHCRFSYGDAGDLKQYLLAEHVEPIKLTHDEYVILKNLGSEWKFIARDCDWFEINLFTDEPTRIDGLWSNGGSPSIRMTLFPNLFQFIKWEDEELYSIEQLIADYEKEYKND